MSLVFESAIKEWHRIRNEYDLHLETQYAQAVDACNTVLLNRRGREAGMDTFSLFSGPHTRALAYASEELVCFWEHTSPRVTYQDFERQYFDSHGRY